MRWGTFFSILLQILLWTLFDSKIVLIFNVIVITALFLLLYYDYIVWDDEDFAQRLHADLQNMNSEWVKTDVAEALQREVHEKRQVLFPIRLMDYEMIQQWDCLNAHEIREYFILDSSNWDHTPHIFQNYR